MIRVFKYLSWGIIILVLLLSAFVAASFYLGSESSGVKSNATSEIVVPVRSGVIEPDAATPEESTPDVSTPDVSTPDVATPELHTELK